MPGIFKLNPSLSPNCQRQTELSFLQKGFCISRAVTKKQGWHPFCPGAAAWSLNTPVRLSRRTAPAPLLHPTATKRTKHQQTVRISTMATSVINRTCPYLRSAKKCSFSSPSHFLCLSTPLKAAKLYEQERGLGKKGQIHTHIQHTVSEESEGSMLVREELEEKEYAGEPLGFA